MKSNTKIEQCSRRAFLGAAAAAGTYAAWPAGAKAWGWGGVDWDLPARDLAGTRSTRWPLFELEERFRVRVAGGVTGSALIQPRGIVAASLGGEVVAVDHDGAERWRRDLGTAAYGGVEGSRELGFFGGPAAFGHRVVVASDRVQCLDARSGETLWSAEPLRTDESDDYFWGGVVVAGGLVLAGSGSGAETPTARGRLSAYALRTGELVWSVPMVAEGQNGGGILSPSTVDFWRGSVYVSTGAPYDDDGTPVPGASSLVEVSLADGELRYRDSLPLDGELQIDLNSAPLLFDRYVYATAKNGIWAWDRLARERLWHTQLTPASSAPGVPSGPTDGPEGGPLCCDGRRLYALSNDGAAGSYVAAALDPRTGEVLWETTLPAFAFAAPAVAGGYLLTASAAGTLHVLRTRDGSEVAQLELGAPSAGAVSSAFGRALVGVGAQPFLPGDELICVG